MDPRAAWRGPRRPLLGAFSLQTHRPLSTTPPLTATFAVFRSNLSTAFSAITSIKTDNYLRFLLQTLILMVFASCSLSVKITNV